ncbi:MAG: hypothetical protein ACXADL_09235 [Candidatus Thorarchaeota archaeon]|jgi:methionine synthase II (cobalamin-independent)
MGSGNNAIRAVDVGSFPISVDSSRYHKGAIELENNPNKVETDDERYFVEIHNSIFLRKLKALGVESSVTSYAQCRGMIDQFMKPIYRAVVKSNENEDSNDSQSATGGLSQDEAMQLAAAIAVGESSIPENKVRISEVIALEHGARELCEIANVEKISYKSCVTGPLELTLNLQRLLGFPRVYDAKLVDFFTEAVLGYYKNAHIKTKHLQPEIVTLDEPSMGLEGLADFFNDSASDTDLAHLITCWNKILREVPNGCYKGLHLHASPFEQLFNAEWNLLEAHVGVFVSPKWTESYDKFVRAAILRTDGPTISKDDDVKAAWKEIYSGNYERYLQSADETVKHLKQSIDLYGIERIPFAGPECGLGSWDWINGDKMAEANLANMSTSLADFQKS